MEPIERPGCGDGCSRRKGAGGRATPAAFPSGDSTIHVAAVYGGAGINVLAVAVSRDGLYAELGSYVRRHAELQLHAEDARRVRRLLEAGQSETAVRLYFARVGERWDREWLATHALEWTDGRAMSTLAERAGG